MRDPYRTLIQLSTRQVIAARSLPLVDLIDGARNGYAPYIGELRIRFGDELERAISPLVADAAPEIVDDVFMALPDTLQRYTEEGRFEAWLFTAAFNRARTRGRGERRRRDGEELHTGVTPASDPTVIDRMTAEAVLERALSVLPSAEREAWLLSYRGHDPKEIAALLGVSANAATVRIHRARKRLADILGNIAHE